MASPLSVARACNIALRTSHIAVTGILLGGHFFGISAGRLLPLVSMAIVTGVALGVAEVYPNWRSVFEVRSLVIASKLVLLCFVPLLWEYRTIILLVVLVMASAGSHMPRRIRHYSLLEYQSVGDARQSRRTLGECHGVISSYSGRNQVDGSHDRQELAK